MSHMTRDHFRPAANRFTRPAGNTTNLADSKGEVLNGTSSFISLSRRLNHVRHGATKYSTTLFWDDPLWRSTVAEYFNSVVLNSCKTRPLPAQGI